MKTAKEGLNILITTGIYPPSIGGPATYSKLLNDELHKKGVKVKILSYDSVRKYPRGISHFVLMFKIVWYGRNVDFIYTQDPVSVGWPTMLACRVLRKKYVLKIVGDFAWEQGVRRFGVKESLDEFVSGNYEYKDDVLRLKKVEKSVADGAGKIIVPSRYLKKIVSKWGIDENKISVIYNAYDEPDKISTQNLRGVNLISVGRLVPWKGFSKLISLMPELLKEIPNIKLSIFGDGTIRNELEDQIKELELESAVFLKGSVSQNELIGYMRASDVFVLNTHYEGLSHTLLEAQAVGLPIVTTNIGGNPEVVSDGENGFLVEYDDMDSFKERILEVLRNKELQEKFSEGGKENIKKFNQEDMLNELISEFQNI